MVIHELRGCLVCSVNTLLSKGAYECEGIYYCFVCYINVLSCTKPNGTLLSACFRAKEILLWWLVLLVLRLYRCRFWLQRRLTNVERWGAKVLCCMVCGIMLCMLEVGVRNKCQVTVGLRSRIDSGKQILM